MFSNGVLLVTNPGFIPTRMDSSTSVTLIRNKKLNRRWRDGWSSVKGFQYMASHSHTETLNKQINVPVVIYLYSKTDKVPTGSRD